MTMKVKNKMVVAIEYSISDTEGSIIDSNKGFSPLEYLHGGANLVPAVEAALEGLSVGDEKQISVKAAEAYGIYNPSLVTEIQRSDVEDGHALQKGDSATIADGREGVVIETSVRTVTIDVNHPLAGEDLSYNVKIISIRQAREEEYLKGEPLPEFFGCGNVPGCC